jgi:hypothetical protein
MNATGPQIKIKAAVLAALSPAEGTILAEALDQLAQYYLEAGPRWRVGQIEHVLCAKETEVGLDEP